MIRGYIGVLGSGKSYSMIWDIVKEFKRDKPQIYANMAGLKCPEAIYIEALHNLPLVTNGKVLLDEVGIFMSSRFWGDVPKSVLQAFALGRKNGLDMYWTAHTEARVDTVLREITSEIVFCRRVGRVIFQAHRLPGTNEVIRRKVIPLDPRIYRLYDTLELISTTGGFQGRGAAAERSLLSRQREARERERQAAARANVEVPLMRSNWIGGYEAHPAAIEAEEYLRAIGGWSLGLGGPEQVRRELRRRAWLKEWGLVAEEAPYYCTPDNPWLRGHDPMMVMERNEAERIEIAEEKLAAKTVRERKNVASGKVAGGWALISNGPSRPVLG